MAWTLSTLNLNGLRSASSKGLFPWLEESGADVSCLQEVRMQQDQIGAEHRPPEGWSTVQLDAEKKGYSGVAVWSRLPIRQVHAGCGLAWADAEARVLRADLEPATVVSLYLPSGSSGEERQARKEEFMEHFLGWSAELLADGRPVVICGDFNISHTERDIHNPKANAKNSGFLPHERRWFSRLLDLGWVDVWRALNPSAQEYSWWSQRGQARSLDRGWRLDYQLASPALAAKARRATIVGRQPALSDHCPVVVEYGD